MSDNGFDRGVKMNAELVTDARGMADAILHKVHRGPGDTIDAAMHRAETVYGVPAQWLHRLRYRHRDLKDIPGSVLLPLIQAYRVINDAAEKAYENERDLAHARNSPLLGLAAALAGSKDSGAAQ